MALGKASVSRRDAGTRDEGPEKTSGAEAGAAGGRGRGGRCLVGVRGEPPGDRDGEKAVFRRRRQAAGRVSEVSSAAGPRPPKVGGFRLPFGFDRVCPPAPALRRRAGASQASHSLFSRTPASAGGHRRLVARRVFPGGRSPRNRVATRSRPARPRPRDTGFRGGVRSRGVPRFQALTPGVGTGCGAGALGAFPGSAGGAIVGVGVSVAVGVGVWVAVGVSVGVGGNSSGLSPLRAAGVRNDGSPGTRAGCGEGRGVACIRAPRSGVSIPGGEGEGAAGSVVAVGGTGAAEGGAVDTGAAGVGGTAAGGSGGVAGRRKKTPRARSTASRANTPKPKAPSRPPRGRDADSPRGAEAAPAMSIPSPLCEGGGSTLAGCPALPSPSRAGVPRERSATETLSFEPASNARR